MLVALVYSSCGRGQSSPELVRTSGGHRSRQDWADVRRSVPSDVERLSGPHVVLRPAGHPPVAVRVEVQRTPEQWQRGLMYRRHLDPMAGMLFVFPYPDHQVFWMRNTYLPLDMIFITADFRVLGVVRNATPMTDDPREVPGESQYVLEVNAGFADRHHIREGTPVELVNIDRPGVPGSW